ncbi:MAG: hypothetical protein KKH44_04380 [Bacteroidetes bacterium]|nr:hypothetical protein [Bacteroidota bacterium]
MKFIKAQEIDKNVKCAIHKTGKLGFSSSAIEKLNLTTEKGVMIAINEEDDSDENLYILINESVNKDTFKISKAGEYFYLNTKALFDSLSIDYRENRIIYDILDFENDGTKMYKLIKRVVGKKIK